MPITSILPVKSWRSYEVGRWRRWFIPVSEDPSGVEMMSVWSPCKRDNYPMYSLREASPNHNELLLLVSFSLDAALSYEFTKCLKPVNFVNILHTRIAKQTCLLPRKVIWVDLVKIAISSSTSHLTPLAPVTKGAATRYDSPARSLPIALYMGQS